MYRGCQTKVQRAAGESGSFNVDVGLYQGSALSPYLFLIFMDVLTEGVRKEVPESMMFADEIVLCGGREVDMTEYLDTWRKSLEERGMRVSRPKTQFMDFNFEQNQQGNREPVKILGEELERVTHFKYLGTSMEEEGGMETEITKRVGAGWRNWKKCSGVLCDRRMPVKLKRKVYKTVIRPAILYGAETWATTKRQEKRIEVTEMRMLRWMCGVTRKDKIRNEHIRGTTSAGFQKDHREKIELVRACDEERWRTHTEESVEGGYTREREEGETENKMERRVSTRFEKYWTDSGRGDGQGDVEKKDHQLYRRPYTMGKARGKEEEDFNHCLLPGTYLYSWVDWGVVPKSSNFETVAKGSFELGSLDCEPGILPLSYRPKIIIDKTLREEAGSSVSCRAEGQLALFGSSIFAASRWWRHPGRYRRNCTWCSLI